MLNIEIHSRKSPSNAFGEDITGRGGPSYTRLDHMERPAAPVRGDHVNHYGTLYEVERVVWHVGSAPHVTLYCRALA